ncbi:YfhJ family protein [Ectobacillus polymachus]|uniref:YfhJ family protein n=1 Tax=Ectobacillus polymachus TaxID=1508806 RepID=UPI003A8877B4
MNDIIEKLTALLLEKNKKLSYAQGRSWVELLWGDFEASYARAGIYNGAEMTERVVKTWIENHGEHLHLIMSNNPKYKHLLNQADYPKH